MILSNISGYNTIMRVLKQGEPTEELLRRTFSWKYVILRRNIQRRVYRRNMKSIEKIKRGLRLYKLLILKSVSTFDF